MNRKQTICIKICVWIGIVAFVLAGLTDGGALVIRGIVLLIIGTLAIAFFPFVVVGPFICLYWLGGLPLSAEESHNRIWRKSHRRLAHIIGFGGFCGTCISLNLGMGTMLSLVTDAIISKKALQYPYPILFAVSLICVFTTLKIFTEGCAWIELKDYKQREVSIKRKINRLRWDYGWACTKDPEHTLGPGMYSDYGSIFAEKHYGIKEEYKQEVAAEIKKKIEELKKNTGSAKKENACQIVKKEELEALYRFLDEIEASDEEDEFYVDWGGGDRYIF